MKLVLASFSRARADLLRAAGYAFTQHPSGVHERPYEAGEDPGAYVEYLADQKATAVAAEYPDHIILGADTVLYMDNRTFGKPADLEDAVRMLTQLSGHTHLLMTGICVVGPDGHTRLTAHDTVNVTMRNWTEHHIRAHVEIAKPLSFAGAYALQQEGCVMVEKLDGDPNTVIGLPMGLVEHFIQQLGGLRGTE